MPEKLTYQTVLQSLNELNAPDELVREFRERFDVYGEEPENVELALVDIACRHGWTRIFEADGKARSIRAVRLPDDSPEYRRDAHSRTPGEEQCYRRGFDQGFAAALEMIKSDGPGAATNEGKRIHNWRTNAVQFMNSPPGSAEPTAYDLRKSKPDRG